MSRRIYAQILVFIFVCLSFLCASAVLADMEQDRADGIAWLLKNQNGDGSWGSGGAKVAATAEALAALKNSGADSGFLYSRAISWLANARADSVDSLARKIISLEAAGFDTTELGLIDELMALRNDQKGWGAFDGHNSGFPDTSLALLAIQNSATPYADLTTSLNLIRSVQAAGNSGWSYVADNRGIGLIQKIMPSAYNVMALSAYQSQSDSSTYTSRGINWLISSRQQPNGSFLDDSTITTGAVHKTALGYLAIKIANDAGVIPAGSAAALASAQSFILAQQSVEGGWNNDAFTTALALRTLPAITMVDTDGDGIPDSVELLLNTDVNVADGRELLDANGLDPDNLHDSGMSASPIILEVMINQALTHTPSLTGGTGPFEWQVSMGGLPPGITLQSSSTGHFSGTPTVAGTSVFSMHVQDAAARALVVAGYVRVLEPDDLLTDTDNDGIPSAFELANGFDPLDNTSGPVATDTDGDGLSDVLETEIGTNPFLIDTDGDGISDYDELQAGTDPLISDLDTDGDGLTDVEELQLGTDPLLSDTDGDSMSDYDEVLAGRDPLFNEVIIIVIINTLLL